MNRFMFQESPELSELSLKSLFSRRSSSRSSRSPGGFARFAAALALGFGLFAGYPTGGAADPGGLRAEPGTIPLDLSIRKSVVLVRITPIFYNYAIPWVKQPGQSYTVVGLVMPGKKILVLANDIRNAALLEVTRYSSYERSLAKVDLIDIEANLALLSVGDDTFFDNLLPLPAGRDPVPGGSVTAVKIDQVFRVYREKLQIKEVNASADFGFTHLPVTVFRSSEPFQNGGILLCQVRYVCGFIGYSDQEKRTESIPPSTFAVFRKRAQSGDYSGFVSQGYVLDELVDPVQREYYRLPKSIRGALVSRVIPGTSAFGVLKPEDVLLSMDGVAVDDLGFYEDPQFGRQHALLLGNRSPGGIRKPGDVVRLKVFRDGEEQSLQMPLRSYSGRAERIPWLVPGEPDYLVENGLLFLEMSVPLVRQLYGKAWERNAIELAQIYQEKRFYENPGDDRVVLLAGALPDPVTRGYEDLRGAPVESLNGEPVHNLKQMRETILELKNAGETIVELRLSGGQPVYLNIKDREAINRRVNARYQIPASSSWD
ncbi:MAG: hypothetical protein RIF32_19235 [Leptospirales bacterium]|jgi:hypothetical protein